MRKTKWSNFAGAVLGSTTLLVTAAAARHMQKKYGEKYTAFRADLSHMAEYAFERLVLNNPKVVEFLSPYFAEESDHKRMEETT